MILESHSGEICVVLIIEETTPLFPHLLVEIFVLNTRTEPQGKYCVDSADDTRDVSYDHT